MALRWTDLTTLERSREFFKLQVAFNRSSHWWRVGTKEEYYFDFDSIVFEPTRCKVVVEVLLEKIRDFQDPRLHLQPMSYLAFIEKRDGGTVGALQLAGALSIRSGIPFCVVRPGKFVLSERVKTPFVEGVPPNHRLKGESCLIVTDHCSTGDEIIETADNLKTLGAGVIGALAYTAIGAEIDHDRLTDAGLTLAYCHSLPEDALAAKEETRPQG